MTTPAPAALARFLDRRRARGRRVAFATIASRAYLPGVLVLFDALARFHPHAARVLLFVQEAGESAKPEIPGAHVITIADLCDAARERTLRRRYNLGELCFAMKPRLLAHLLDRHGERAFYLDADLDVYAPFDAALVLLERASAVLTPHLDVPLPEDGHLPSDLTILRGGAYNMGFVAVAESAEARALLGWWDQRAFRWGYMRPERGYQGDQKWMDLAPGLFPRVAILRDPAYNVGYWNLHSRAVEFHEGRLAVNGAPAAFFHWSGFDAERPEVLSRFEDRHAVPPASIVPLLAEYARRLHAASATSQVLAWSATQAHAHEAAGSVTTTDAAMPDTAYAMRLSVASPPVGVFATGEEIVLEVEVTNTSPDPWPVGRLPDGRGGIALTWHLLDTAGTMLVWDNPRFPLSRDLASGEAARMEIGIFAPQETGRFQLQLDLIHEGFAWFSRRGSPVATVDIVVGMPAAQAGAPAA